MTTHLTARLSWHMEDGTAGFVSLLTMRHRDHMCP
jgi:hypothetical protein